MGAVGGPPPARTVKGRNMRTRFRPYLVLLALVALTPFLSACGLLRQSRSHCGSAPTRLPPRQAPGNARGRSPPPPPRKPRPPNRPRHRSWRSNASPRAISTGPTGRWRPTRRVSPRALWAKPAPPSFRRGRRPRATRRCSAGTSTTRGRSSGSAASAGGPPGEWVIVTREQTGGDQEYAGIQAAFHVTLASVARVTGGWR